MLRYFVIFYRVSPKYIWGKPGGERIVVTFIYDTELFHRFVDTFSSDKIYILTLKILDYTRYTCIL